MEDFATDRIVAQAMAGRLADASARATLQDELAAVLTPKVLQHLPEPLQLEEGEDAIARWLARQERDATLLALRERQSEELIGVLICAVFAEPGEERTIHLGYLFAEDAWGKGYASEMLAGLVAALSRQERPTRLYAGVGKDNPASARVLRKTGFAEDLAAHGDAETMMFTLRLPA